MKVFVWADVDRCSDNYHANGGVVVFADSEERARELANATRGCAIKESETPDDVRGIAGEDQPEAVFIFPNAGCC
jgi:hypothetical protein